MTEEVSNRLTNAAILNEAPMVETGKVVCARAVEPGDWNSSLFAELVAVDHQRCHGSEVTEIPRFRSVRLAATSSRLDDSIWESRRLSSARSGEWGHPGGPGAVRAFTLSATASESSATRGIACRPA